MKLLTVAFRFSCSLALGLFAGTVQAQNAAPQQPVLIVHLLDYIAVDYPQFVRDGEVLDAAEFAEQQEFAAEVHRLLTALPANAARSELEAATTTLSAAIASHADGELVAQQANSLRNRVIAEYAIAASPGLAPKAAQGAQLYAAQCSGCHGPTGHGDGPAAAALDPAPSDFHDVTRMEQRSLFGLYNTISLGVTGTSMVGFNGLADADRWALAFHVANLRQTTESVSDGQQAWESLTTRERLTDLRSLVNTTAVELPSAEERRALVWLTAHPETLQSSTAAVLGEGQALLKASLEAYKDGAADRAQELAVAAYLQGFEPIESLLDASAPQLRIAVESDMQALRAALRAGAPQSEINRLAVRVSEDFDQVRDALGAEPMSAKTAAVSAFVILFREGLEAILVVAAVLALVARAGRRDAKRYVHAGWIAALAAGGLTWFVADTMIDISGASREITEGVTALLAAVILLYVGYWMHSKANARGWQKFISSQLKGALSGRTLWALSGVAFLAVYREAFETVLFVETLWAQGGTEVGSALIGGLFAATAALLLISFLVFRYGMRLPIGTFFTVSSALMAVLAFVFAGQGVAALQEAGTLPVDPLALPRLGWLGIFPTVQTIAAQALVVVVIALGLLASFRAQRTVVPGN